MVSTLDRLQEVERLGADEGSAGREEHAHRAREGCADGEGPELELVGRYAHGGGRQLVLPDGRPGPAHLGVVQAVGDDDRNDHDDQGYQVEQDVVELVHRDRSARPGVRICR